jgi:hypothetical protein
MLRAFLSTRAARAATSAAPTRPLTAAQPTAAAPAPRTSCGSFGVSLTEAEQANVDTFVDRLRAALGRRQALVERVDRVGAGALILVTTAYLPQVTEAIDEVRAALAPVH